MKNAGMRKDVRREGFKMFSMRPLKTHRGSPEKSIKIAVKKKVVNYKNYSGLSRSQAEHHVWRDGDPDEDKQPQSPREEIVIVKKPAPLMPHDEMPE